MWGLRKGGKAAKRELPPVPRIPAPGVTKPIVAPSVDEVASNPEPSPPEHKARLTVVAPSPTSAESAGPDAGESPQSPSPGDSAAILSSDNAPQGNEPEDYAVISHIAKVPSFLRLLTVGDDAVYRLPQGLRDKLVALDLGTKQAVLLRSTDEGKGEMPAEVRAHARSLKGALRELNFHLGEDLLATPAVLQDVLRNQGVRTRGNGKGRPLELFERWVEIAVRDGATDMHVRIRDKLGQVLVRVDGALEPLRDGSADPGVYPRQEALDAISAAYNDTRTGANTSQYEPDKFCDCMIDFDNKHGSGKLRYQNMRGRMGPAVVVRILRNESGPKLTFERAGYAPSHLRLWKLAARAGKGLIIIAGVTGSGKSTTLKCLIETLPGLPQKAVWTVEDPIEYEIQGAHQIEVLRDLSSEEETKRRYGAVMKGLMRADPDAVMVGEIRDKLTATFALQIAETGHLAMGTTHAHLISNIIPRLTNDEVGLKRESLTSPNIINLLVYQYLVARVCPKCGETGQQAAEHDPEIREYIDILESKFKVPTDKLRFVKPGGCPHCEQRGTKGKTVVAEMWQPDRTWLQHIRNNDDYAALLHYRSLSDRDFTSADMTGKTVFEHTLWKALQGEVDPRNCEEFETFERFEILGPRE